jgi:hypothetical protein
MSIPSKAPKGARAGRRIGGRAGKQHPDSQTRPHRYLGGACRRNFQPTRVLVASSWRVACPSTEGYKHGQRVSPVDTLNHGYDSENGSRFTRFQLAQIVDSTSYVLERLECDLPCDRQHLDRIA